MPNLPISGLPAVGGPTVAAWDLFAVDEIASNTTKKATLSQVLASAVSGGAGLLAAHVAASPIQHAVGSIDNTHLVDRTHRDFLTPYLGYAMVLGGGQYVHMGEGTPFPGMDMRDEDQTIAWGQWRIPEDFVGSLTGRGVVICEPNAGTPLNLYYQLEAHFWTCLEAVPAAAVVSSGWLTEPVTLHGANMICNCLAPMAIAGVSVGDYLMLSLERNSVTAGGGAPDTINDNVVFWGFEVAYTRDH